MTAASSPPPRDGEVCNDWCGPGSHHMPPCPAAPSEPPAADSPTPGTCQCPPDDTGSAIEYETCEACFLPYAAPSPVDTEPPAEAQQDDSCTTPGCTGDPRYAAPGRGHMQGCRHPFTGPAEAQQDDETCECGHSRDRHTAGVATCWEDTDKRTCLCKTYCPAVAFPHDFCCGPGEQFVQQAEDVLSEHVDTDNDAAADAAASILTALLPAVLAYGDARATLAARPSADTETLRPALDEAHLAHQRAWSLATFGPGTREKGVSDHIRKELIEVRDAKTVQEKRKEWIDVVILALDGAWRSGMEPTEIIAGVKAKQARNEARTWPDWRTADPDKAIEHDRAAMDAR